MPISFLTAFLLIYSQVFHLFLNEEKAEVYEFKLKVSVIDSQASGKMYFDLTIQNNSKDTMVYPLLEYFSIVDSVVIHLSSNWTSSKNQDFIQVGIWSHDCEVDTFLTLPPKKSLNLKWVSSTQNDKPNNSSTQNDKPNKRIDFTLRFPFLKSHDYYKLYKKDSYTLFCEIYRD